MLTVHHLRRSRSERIVWLCEELELAYRLQSYVREPLRLSDGACIPAMGLAPPAYKALHALGSAPVIEDRGLVLAESGAIIDYLLARYGHGRLVPEVSDPAFVTCTYWRHFTDGTLQPAMGRLLFLHRLGDAAAHFAGHVAGQVAQALDLLDAQLAGNNHLAGEDFTLADLMLVFPLTTMRLFAPLDLDPYQAVRAWLGRIAARPAYRRAMAAGDPGLAPNLS